MACCRAFARDFSRSMPKRLPVTAERFPAENELVGAVTSFERGIENLEIKNRERENPGGLYRHLAWMRALCEVDRKFLASLDLRLVTDALLETVAQLFPGSATTVWLLDTTTDRLEAVACRNLAGTRVTSPLRQIGGLDFAMEVVEKRIPCDDHERRGTQIRKA